MIRLLASALWAGAVTTALTLLAGAALAQGAPPLASMPMPPSATEAAPKETGKAKPKKTTARKAEGGVGNGTPARSGSANSFERPSQYVPEEFDRGRGGSGGSARPFMSESGRPGMGMRF